MSTNEIFNQMLSGKSIQLSSTNCLTLKNVE